MRSEQGVLRVSIIITVALAAFGIVIGLVSGSFAIMFDGIYSLADAGMTVVALLVANLISSSTTAGPIKQRLVERFTMGFWHLEPMVLGLNGMLLIGAAIYALINSIAIFLAGGHVLDFNKAVIYATITLIITVAMTIFDKWANQTIGSQFVELDAKAWMMTSALTAALLVAFAFGIVITGTKFEWLLPYIDPSVLGLVSVAVIPIPAGMVKRALEDILLVTPSALKQDVDNVAREVTKRYGFLFHRAYVARVGRGRQIELYFVVPTGWPPKQLEEWDRIRDDIGEAIGGEGADRWLTIVFTTDREWAD